MQHYLSLFFFFLFENTIPTIPTSEPAKIITAGITGIESPVFTGGFDGGVVGGVEGGVGGVILIV